jgi:hypothetical protein
MEHIPSSHQEKSSLARSFDQERSIDSLYIGRADNGSRHTVFKLSTKQVVSVNRVTTTPTSESIVQTVNDIGEQEGQPEGIQFSNLNGEITLQDFAENDNDEDSNASDDDFKIDDEYKEEMSDEIALEEEESVIGNDDPDTQEDYFQTPIQQHENSVRDNNEPASITIQNSKRGNNDDVVTLSNTTIPEIQECGKQNKKKKTDSNDTSVQNDLDDDDPYNIIDNTKVGVGCTDDAEGHDEKEGNIDGDNTPKELNSNLGPYWALTQLSQAYVLNTITSYSNIEASNSTPQYSIEVSKSLVN